jgi:DNA-binding MarR family transcriptional regulator
MPAAPCPLSRAQKTATTAVPPTPAIADEVVCAHTLPLHAFLTFKLVALANTLQTQVTRHYVAPVTPVGLTEWRLMGLLHEHGELHAGALARLSAIDKGQISRALQPLIDAQWLHRRTDPEHARRHLLSLSSEGHAQFNNVLQQARPLQAALWNALTVPERAALEHIMEKLTAAARVLDAQASAAAAQPATAAAAVKVPHARRKPRSASTTTSAA